VVDGNDGFTARCGMSSECEEKHGSWTKCIGSAWWDTT
jgi:hypothetical protein